MPASTPPLPEMHGNIGSYGAVARLQLRSYGAASAKKGALIRNTETCTLPACAFKSKYWGD